MVEIDCNRLMKLFTILECPSSVSIARLILVRSISRS